MCAYDQKFLDKVLDSQLIDTIPVNYEETLLFANLYEYISICGKGSFGIVVKAIDKANLEIRAIKIIKKEYNNQYKTDKLLEEAAILKNMNHQNIVKLYDLYTSKKHIFMVMEYLEGGPLSDITNQNIQLSDENCSIITKNILCGLAYIHMKQYIHRDLKPDNIIFATKGDFNSLKIVDFGLGVRLYIGLGLSFDKQSGTLLYMAPEQANSVHYSNLVDIWACGMIMYTLLNGSHPFYIPTDTDETYLSKLNKPNWSFPSTFRPLAVNFFLSLCNVEFCKRYDAFLALEHPWITRNDNDPIPLTIEDEIFLTKRKDFLKRVILVFKLCYIISSKSPLLAVYKEKVDSEKLPSISVVTVDGSEDIKITRKRSSSLVSKGISISNNLSHFSSNNTENRRIQKVILLSDDYSIASRA